MNISNSINPPLIGLELIQSAELLGRARDLIRAAQQQIDLTPYIAALETALAPYANSQYYDWCADVECSLSRRLSENGTPFDISTLEWDSNELYAQNLTVPQAADKFYYDLTSKFPNVHSQ